MAGVGVAGVVLALSVRSSAVSGNAAQPGAPQPPQERVAGAMAVKPSDPALASGAEKAPSPEKRPPPKAQRIEDLPTATPVAYRPLRVEELPEAPPAKGKSRRGKGGPVAGQPLRIEDLPAVSDAVRPLRPDELNPELVKRADDLLWNHPAPVGVDVPFEVGGKNYIARFALHYHEFGSDKKPWGYHKGITIYSTWQ
jgi:hypothetical protein